MQMNKKGSIPIVLLVILTVVILALILGSFLWIGQRDKGEIEGYRNVEKYNLQKAENTYLGKTNGNNVIEEYSYKKYLLFGEKILKFKVESIK